MENNYGLGYAFTREPAARSFLALCVIVVGANTAANGLALGCILAAILLVSNLILSIFRKMIGESARLAAAIILCSALAGAAQMAVNRFCPLIGASLGVFLPLCGLAAVLSGRCDEYACTHSVLASVWDAIRFGVPMAFVLTLIGVLRELMSYGSIFGLAIIKTHSYALVAAYPVGAFILLGILLGIVNAIVNRGKEADK